LVFAVEDDGLSLVQKIPYEFRSPLHTRLIFCAKVVLVGLQGTVRQGTLQVGHELSLLRVDLVERIADIQAGKRLSQHRDPLPAGIDLPLEVTTLLHPMSPTLLSPSALLLTPRGASRLQAMAGQLGQARGPPVLL
jgi:hypothetical protein